MCVRLSGLQNVSFKRINKPGMRPSLCIFMLFAALELPAQNKNYLSIAFTDQATSYPFTILAGYFTEPIHPGIEFSWGKNFKEKPAHDWFREFRLGYFYHRFVQHGISLYAG